MSKASPEQHDLPLAPVLDAGWVAGIDEAGRGPLAGPVVAAAVVLDPDRVPEGVDDSKRLSASARERLADLIKHSALAWHVAQVDVEEIDRINILNATMQAMARAVAGIESALVEIRVDGNRAPNLEGRHAHTPVSTWIKGDQRCAAIAAASILAKTARDQLMTSWHQRWPEYGFAQHMGYGTKAHIAALELHGPCDIHRRSFAPVRQAAEMRRTDHG